MYYKIHIKYIMDYIFMYVYIYKIYRCMLALPLKN